MEASTPERSKSGTIKAGTISDGSIRTTCPRDCYDACGIRVLREDGAVRHVVGDRDHPVSRGSLCGKCALAYNGAWRDPDARLGTPLRRVGAKGEGRFEAIGWDAALAEIAGWLTPLLAAGTPEKILTAHYTGTTSVLAGAFPMRFFNHVGATEVEPDTVCNNAGHVALGYVLGTSVKGFDPRTIRDSACVLVWGCNPSASAPHAHKHWLAERPGKMVVVDPIRTPTAAMADLHLQPRPGTDAALAFGMLHVLQRDGLVDTAFLADHTIGWEELAALLPPCTPDWAAAQTGVPAADIEAAARLYGAGPSMLWLGQALQRQRLGGNIMRACAMLPAVTGQIGRPGTGIYYLNGKGATRNLPMGDVAGERLRTAPPRAISHMDLADRLALPASAPDGFGALLLWNINIVASNPQQAALKAALARDDLFTVVIDLFGTDSADFADIVLPAASFLEFDDLVCSYMHLSVSAQAKAMEPVGEALPNQEIFRRLARAMGLTEPALFEGDRAIIDRLLAASGLGIDFDRLKAAGTVPVSPDPVMLFGDLRFPTPSGRIEIASARAAADGFPLVPQPQVDPAPADGRLRLLSPASEWHMNSSYDNVAKVADQAGAEVLTLNPGDAARLGIADGSAVEVRNALGALTFRAHLDPSMLPGTALAPKGRWLKRSPQHANVNLLNPGERSDMGDSTAVHNVEVSLAPLPG
ncbi:molybdopterin-dependent oxidoreductase [Marinibaculum pumilum]|uniref:Molybdopterin-dependent oxidoreductase n=1 Tax=Marinibaculum pumilum TaxID=1766165 RepID=A0ABV7L671_9PROT